ncbi:MAG: 4Fe-4S binding protein, partial [Planctomycetota bacterium]
WLYCPEGCITRGTYEIDAAYCKGCGICAEECRRGAIRMVREAE